MTYEARDAINEWLRVKNFALKKREQKRMRGLKKALERWGINENTVKNILYRALNKADLAFRGSLLTDTRLCSQHEEIL